MANGLTSKGIGRRMPKRPHGTLIACILFVFLIPPCSSFGQALIPRPAELVIAGGTPVKLQLAQTISSAHARNGDRLDFEVVEDVSVGGFTVIRAGAMANGSVVKVDGKRPLGLGGKMIIKLESVALVTGDRVRLQARQEFKGGSHTKLMAEGMLLASVIYIPAAPVFLLSHGSDCTVLKGSEVTAYIDGDARVQSAELAEAKDGESRLKQMIALLPPRVLDGQGREGDMINFVFVAREDELQRVFARAGWIKVDKMKATLFWHLAWQREHYIKLPMETLYAFGRRQDYSYALPDPSAVLTRRHHLRIWRTGFEVNDTPVWVGAATHDVAIEFEKRKLWMIHRIDPDVDAERDFIAWNLAETHMVARLRYLASAVPVFEAQTTKGEAYHSDSRIILLDLSQRPARELAQIQTAGPFVRNQIPSTPK